MAISCLAAYSKGLIIGSERGHFGIWIKDEDPEKIMDKKSDEDYNLVYLRSWATERGGGVSSIDIGNNDELMAIGFKNNDVALFNLSKVIPTVPEALEQMKRNLKNLEKRVKFEYIFSGSHYGPITHMDVCIQRPLIVTCSE
jgi:hypothetical protein